MFKQGDIIIIRYPLSDKPEKSIIRPVVIVSNDLSNSLDKDVLVCQITTNLRNDKFSFLLNEKTLTDPMQELCEVGCNKIATVRVWDKIIQNKVSAIKKHALTDLLLIVKEAF